MRFEPEPVTTPIPPNKVSSVIEPPRDTDVPLIVIDEFDNFEFIEPPKSAFVIEPDWIPLPPVNVSKDT